MEIFVNWTENLVFKNIDEAINFFFHEDTNYIDNFLYDNYSHFEIFNMTEQEKAEIKKEFLEKFLETVKI